MNNVYSLAQWILFFYLYSFIGWVYESIYVSIKEKRWVNRGFMRGPFLPLYGSGAVAMLFVTIPFRDNWALTFIAGCIGATTLEYITGVTMEALFKVRYWDYSKEKFNFQGHICLGASLAWGLFTILLTFVIHKPIERMVLSIPITFVRYFTFFLSIFIVSDFSLSFKAALDLRDVLVKMDRVKEELVRMQKRLDVILAFAGETKENTSQRAEEIIESLENKFKSFKEMLPKWELSDERKEEIAELRIKLGIHKEKQFQLSHVMDFWRNNLIKGNPGMISVKFREGLEDIKKVAMESKRKRKNVQEGDLSDLDKKGE